MIRIPVFGFVSLEWQRKLNEILLSVVSD